ncbi:MAG: pyruvate formate lyase family protein, partial [Deltaproteobacteria bacterium]|nr:pyruvate formate lyase family protein [Deltaproteobacteria bacterium]
MKHKKKQEFTSRHKETSERFSRIKNTLFSTPIYLCPERALLVTEHFKKFDNADEPMLIRKAKAFRYLMQNKSAKIFDDELIAGNFGAHRKSALIQPELAGVFMCEDILWINKRKTTPFKMSWADRFKVIFKVIPFWMFRNMPLRALMPGLKNMLRYLIEQLNATYYLINEAGGIGHFLPNYEKIINLGVKGYLEGAERKDGDFYEAARIACEGIIDFSSRLALEAEQQAKIEDSYRADELREIARICRKVPNEPAETFHEAIQSLWLSHMGVCLEGLNSAVSFGRIDQYLYPFYEKDIKNGRTTPEKAKELLLCFSAKTTEHVFLLSERSSKYHGGFLVAQAAIVGGIDRQGNDSVNDLSYLFLDVMEESGLREPNYQVRISKKTSDAFIDRAVEVALKGLGVPAFFNDEVTISALERHGYPLEDARDYGIVGCVEPSIQGKSFLSTDASLFNLPICLELALNKGKRLNDRKRIGAATIDAESITDMDHVMTVFKEQVVYMVDRLIKDIQIIEKGNRDFHPTPFSSMLVDGCLESGIDVTAGGAQFNGSGIQGVGVADTADSLAAIDTVLMQNRDCS